MPSFLDSFLRFSADMTETGILVADSALRMMQSSFSVLRGSTPSRPLSQPPLDGPTDIDTATSDFGNRLTRIINYAPRDPSALPELSREVWDAAVKSFSRIKFDRPTEWVSFGLELPFSVATLVTEMSLRVGYATHNIPAYRLPEFMWYMMETFLDYHVFLGLQYQEEAERFREQSQRFPDDPLPHFRLGRNYIKCGRYLEAARELAIAAKDPGLRPQALYNSTVANYRAGNYQQAVKDGSAELSLRPESEKTRFWVWLAAQKLGGYPDYVAPEARMEMKIGYEQPTVEFENVSEKIGLDKTSGGRGTAVIDVDGDGYLDVVITAAHGGCQLYRNNGDGTFTDASVGSSLDGCVNAWNVTAGDYNNDGFSDLYISRFGFFAGESVLYRNNGDGTFTDVTRESGVGCWGSVFVSSWVDYNCDGNLDLFVATNNGGVFDRKTTNHLFHNNGDGTFTDVTHTAGLYALSPATGNSWGDYNNDGYPDLFINTGLGRAQLFRNNGDGTFTDVSREAGIDQPGFGMPALWLDYDNDGWLDLIQFIWSPLEDVVSTMRHGRAPDHASPLRLYHNNRDGTFTNRSREVGLDQCWGTMSATAGDFNNDGLPELLLGNGSPHMDRTEPAIIYERRPGGTFHNTTFAAGLPFTGKGHGANMADLAGDGRLSLIVATGGAYPGDLLTTSVFRPKKLPGNYLNVRLVGTRSNRDAIGARMMLRAGGREQHRLVSPGSGFGCLPFEQHFGLGDFTAADTLQIRWPSGLEQRIEGLPVNTTVRIVEGQNRWDFVYPPKPDVSQIGDWQRPGQPDLLAE